MDDELGREDAIVTVETCKKLKMFRNLLAEAKELHKELIFFYLNLKGEVDMPILLNTFKQLDTILFRKIFKEIMVPQR